MGGGRTHVEGASYRFYRLQMEQSPKMGLLSHCWSRSPGRSNCPYAGVHRVHRNGSPHVSPWGPRRSGRTPPRPRACRVQKGLGNTLIWATISTWKSPPQPRKPSKKTRQIRPGISTKPERDMHPRNMVSTGKDPAFYRTKPLPPVPCTTKLQNCGFPPLFRTGKPFFLPGVL